MGTKVPIASQKFLLSKRDEVHFLSLTKSTALFLKRDYDLKKQFNCV